METSTRLMQSSNEDLKETINRIGIMRNKSLQNKCEHGQSVMWCPVCKGEKILSMWEQHLTKDIDPSKSGIPRRYWGCSLDTFEGNPKLVNECRSYIEGGMVLSGNTGCGKTHLAISLMKEYEYRKKLKGYERNKAMIHENPEGMYSPTTIRMKFITIPDLLLEIRSSFKESSSIQSEESIIDEYTEITFLVLDDLGSEKTSEYAITTLYIILDRRDREMMDTIITTNLSLAMVEEKLSARIASRMAGMKNIKINMHDYRKKRG